MQVKELIKELVAGQLTVATAESCTGGLLAGAITSVPGSSACFSYGVVTYSNQAKSRLLQVPEAVLLNHGAVSRETAIAMAEGLLALSAADLAVSVTGIAGPDGGSPEKPVGLVFICLADKNGSVIIKRCSFCGNREEIRNSTVNEAINILCEYLKGENDDK